MVWFKVDDGLATHPKTVLAGNAAMGLWVRAGSWCAQQLTEGVVPLYMVPTLGTKSQAERLVAAGFWVKHPKGYKFHQWDEDGRQPTRESVEAVRAANRDRQKKLRDKAKESRDSNAVTNGDVTGGVTVPPTRPDPTRPLTNLPEEMAGGITGDPEPPRKCSQHASMDIPPKCGQCADARVAWDAWRLRHYHDPLVPSSVLRAEPTCEHDRPAGTYCDICVGIAVAS